VLLHLADGDVADKMFRLWIVPIMQKKLEAAYGKLEELLEVHKEHPMTTNHQFVDNRMEIKLQKRDKDFEDRVNSAAPDHLFRAHEIITMKLASIPKISPDMDVVAAEDALDNMIAYYRVNRRTCSPASPFPKLDLTDILGRHETIYG
jgi:hypothetical protein